MSLDKFQRALAQVVASPQQCIALRRDSSLLDAYDLEPRERQRLLAIVSHEGMSHNCTLYRANRLTPVVRSLPRTCELLAGRLTEVLEQFWADRPDAEVQFKLEAERFGHYILQHATSGLIEDEQLVAVLREEIDGLDELFGLDCHP
ncbi:MAG: hypothetical protein WBM58_05865 [Sedimenticolaceae bacterium]